MRKYRSPNRAKDLQNAEIAEFFVNLCKHLHRPAVLQIEVRRVLYAAQRGSRAPSHHTHTNSSCSAHLCYPTLTPKAPRSHVGARSRRWTTAALVQTAVQEHTSTAVQQQKIRILCARKFVRKTDRIHRIEMIIYLLRK